MKKAKEYAREFVATGKTDEGIYTIMSSFLQEVLEIRKKRGVITNGGMFAILNQQDEKWKSFAREVGNSIRGDGFARIIRKRFPEIYFHWIRSFPEHEVKHDAIIGPSDRIQAALHCDH